MDGYGVSLIMLDVITVNFLLLNHKFNVFAFFPCLCSKTFGRVRFFTSGVVHQWCTDRLLAYGIIEVMMHLIDIIGPIYQDLLKSCEQRKIAVNLDVQDLTVKISEPELVNKFFKAEIRRALKNCTKGDKITISEANNSEFVKLSVKNSGRETLTEEEKEKLRSAGYEVRARFGYDTIVSMKIAR